MSKRRRILVILRIFVAAVAVYLGFRGENLGELRDALAVLDLWVIAAALGLFGLGQVIFVLRWRLLLHTLSIHISLWTGMKLHFLGLFYNNCLPSSIGGDMLRAWYIGHHTEGHKRFEAALSVFLDRFIGLFGMLVMAMTFYWFVPVESADMPLEEAQNGGFLGYLTAYKWVFVGIGVVIAAVPALICISKSGRDRLVKAFRRLWDIGGHVLLKTSAAIKLYSKRPFTLLAAIGMTFLCQGVCIIGFWLMGRNMGMEAHIKYYFVLFPLSWLIGTVPVSIGGLGIMEGWLKVMFSQLPGVSSQQGLNIGYCQRLLWWAWSLPGLRIHLAGSHLPENKEEIFVDAEGDPE